MTIAEELLEREHGTMKTCDIAKAIGKLPEWKGRGGDGSHPKLCRDCAALAVTQWYSAVTGK